jgi:uncharacterized protein (TIGR03083 family)
MATEQLHDIASLLANITVDELDQDSLCRGWRIKDVVGHVCSAADLRLAQLVSELGRARLQPNEALRRSAIAYANGHTAADMTAQLRTLAARYHAGRRARSGRLTRPAELLVDYIVHTADITRPLGRALQLPEARLLAALDAAPTIGGLMRCKQRVRGLRLVATDLHWHRGQGPVIEGTAEALLLAMTGRPVAIAELTGDGVTTLAARM